MAQRWSLKAVKQRIRALDWEMQELHERMEALVQEFKGTWTPPWPAHPALCPGRSEAPTLIKWRPKGSMGQGQSTVHFTNEGLQEKLDVAEIPISTRLAWIEFDRRIQVVNTEARLAHYERRRLRDYVSQLQRLNALEKWVKSAQ
ncbi:hypothetical protein [Aquisalimonas asiatica]|uniref:Uncharacterized protein n=1 Tax=Aquisalimonas asiatica TaxID=406100 RepID=A0A1H8VQL9_9GAMM|nr:hypothetical protein [Aquisalimonas asiatica]SEP17624.1 hypothetical protein SAMN04488052_11451 [Aquisalimonas asiatica]